MWSRLWCALVAAAAVAGPRRLGAFGLQTSGESVAALRTSSGVDEDNQDPTFGDPNFQWPVPPSHWRFNRLVNKHPITRGRMVGFPRMFDWHFVRDFDLPDNDLTKDPRTVFVSAHEPTMAIVLNALARFDNNRADRIAYVTGDTLLSAFNATQKALLKKFFKGGIFWQARDKPEEGFRAAPAGLNEFYMRVCYKDMDAAIWKASVPGKSKNVLAAWGRLHDISSFIPSRQKADVWVNTSEAKSMGVEKHSFDMNRYWEELPKYRFLLAPSGAGILSPKTDEALLVYTIPIVMRGGHGVFDDLVKMGWPIVVVNEWSEITDEKLDRWWRELSPRLASFRSNCLTSKGFYRLISGEMNSCH